MIQAYKFTLTEWDKTNGIGPQLLAQARQRAAEIAAVNQAKDMDYPATMYFRGLYAEIQSLVASLEDSGVSHV